MRRYTLLDQVSLYPAVPQLSSAFLAAKDGNEVENIINGLLTPDEKLKIGRRIQIAECLQKGMTVDEICQKLKVGNTTVVFMGNNLLKYPEFFKIISKRERKVEDQYQGNKYRKVGGSTLVIKRKIYTGFKRKDVKR